MDERIITKRGLLAKDWFYLRNQSFFVILGVEKMFAVQTVL